MRREIGVAVLGTGFMGRTHGRAWLGVGALFGDVPRARIVSVCDVDGVAARRLAAELGAERATTDWREALRDPAVEAVSIALPNGMHREVACAALEAGRHVWCEKPMAVTLPDAEAMSVAAAARPDRVTALGYNYARNPALAHARRLVEGGRLGRLTHVRACFDEDYAADAALPWTWRHRKSEAGLGVLADLMCHALSIVLPLAGPIASVVGTMLTAHPTRCAADGAERAVENEDVAQALLRFRSGATGVVTSSRVAWGRRNRLALELHGTRGTLSFDQERMNELVLALDDDAQALGGMRTVLTGPAHPPYGLFSPSAGHSLGFHDLKLIEAADFLRAIDGRGPAPTPFGEGLAIERAVHAIAESAERGGWIVLD